MPSIINATTTAGVAVTGDNSGALALQTNNGTTAVTIDTSQNVGIGTTSPNAKLQVVGNVMAGNGTASTPAYHFVGSSAIGMFTPDAGFSVAFSTGSTERMRISSAGNLLVGTTTASGNRLDVVGGGVAITASGTSFNLLNITDSVNQSGATYIQFYNSTGGNIGNINRVGTTNAVVYNTSSDQRLKSNITDANPVLDKLMNVKVRQFDWTVGDLHQDAGFIAQELAPVLSGVVTEGKTENDWWQIDYSRLTPYLVKAIQELNAKVEAQAVRIAELEGAK